MAYSNKKKDFWSYTLIFVLICVIGYSPFWSHGKSLIWKIDGLGQYYPSFLYIGQFLRACIFDFLHGAITLPLFDISIGMGEDIIGTLNYYGFGDPLNVLAIFATKENGAYAFTLMYFLRLYLSGLCFRKYCSYLGVDRILSNAGALCYIFSGYSLIGGARYMQFLTPMIYLPLMLLGCEKIFREKKTLLFTFSVAYAALCNFYFLYMTSLFLLVYCIIRCVSIYGIKQMPKIFKVAVTSIGSYLLGILLAAPILFPSIDAYLNSCRNSSDPKGNLLYIENYLLNKDKWFQYIRGWNIKLVNNYWTGIPLVQCACLIGAVFPHKSKRSRQCALAVIMGTVFWCMPITSIAFSGFGTVYTRWVFLLYFIYAVVFVCFVGRFYINELVKWIILFVIALNICVNQVILYGSNGENWNDEFVAFSDVTDYIESPVNKAESISDDDDIYRIANDTYTDINGRPENIGMLNGYNGLTFWFSIINGNVQRMIDQIATPKKTEWRSYGLNNITVYETLAGVKYYISKGNDIQKAGYECVEDVTFEDSCWKVYKNENALPLIYTYKECITEDFFNQLNEIEKVEAVSKYIALDKGYINPVSQIETSLIYELETHKEQTHPKMTIECDVDNDEIYLEIGSDGLQDKTGKFILNHNANALYKGNVNKKIIYNLGTAFADSKLIFSMDSDDLTDEEIDSILKQTKIYAINFDKYKKTIQERNELEESNIHITGNKIKLTNVHIKEPRWMMLAVPHSSNWKCYVDGRETDVYKGNKLYMAVRLEEGSHDILFVYRNDSFLIGSMLSFVALLIIIIKIKEVKNNVIGILSINKRCILR